MGEPLLRNLRLGFACQEKWDDMVGDDRVRDCGSCERQVFNLSEMTRAEAEALLATRGIKPCVRFYRRPDGTVMTRDCPTGEVRERRKLAVVAGSLGATLAVASPARADDKWTAVDPATGAEVAVPVDAVPSTVPADDPSDPPLEVPPDPPIKVVGTPVQIDTQIVEMGIPIDRNWETGEIYISEEHRPKVEWSVWGRLGVGITSMREEPAVAARRVTMPPEQLTSISTWNAALGAELTFPMASHGDVRIGVWGEARTTTSPVAGGELVLEGLPPKPYSSHIGGTGSLVLRAGANDRVITWAVGFGYVGSFTNNHPWVEWARHVVGARLIFAMDRAIADPREWSATLGLEVEPIGALHALYDLATGD